MTGVQTCALPIYGMTLRALIDALRATGIELTGVLKEGRWKTKRVGAEEYASLVK